MTHPKSVKNSELEAAEAEGRDEAFQLVLDQLRTRLDEVNSTPVASQFNAHMLVGKSVMLEELIEYVSQLLKAVEEVES